MKKAYLVLLFLVFLSVDVFAHSQTQNTVVRNGIGLGSVIAVVISWSRNESILFAILHGILSWFYVIYYFFALKEK
ncbi:hypothetical protein [Polaribacter sp.]|uniref:hypothetical protein n=1 Tax=Polaribacter sp. TaxID=1920175 RepID=UPI003F6B266C